MDAYRKLLAGRVSGAAINVVTQPPSNGQPAIHRIRIGPLTRSEGNALKADLAGADARFQNAYLVTNR